ncbi:MAG: hypothetical protein E5W95_18000 [Mesorhizobium sp.]|nr:hypothetical protein [Mesorhizobium sp.]TIS37506.1 MAG: hypothetical protein E5W95_18000 [Mesorhizobium sp.]
MKKQYFITESAGKTVAGVPNPGVDLPVLLTPHQAEHALRLGYLTEEAPAPKADDAKKAKKKD